MYELREPHRDLAPFIENYWFVGVEGPEPLDLRVDVFIDARDWMPLGAADEQEGAAECTAEAWGRSPKIPVGGWYGQKRGYRGRLAMYVPPLLEALGKVELERNPKNNRVRAK